MQAPLADQPASPRPRRILVVEDDGGMRLLLQHTLRDAGYEVIEASDGDRALDVLRQTLDLAILDVNMPSLSGIRILAWLKRSNSSLPVVLITAFGSPELHRQALRLGAVKVFDKPFPMSSLVQFIQSIVQTRSP